MNSCHKFHDIADISNSRLNDRELVTSQPCDKIGVSDTAPDASRHGLQQLVADMMSERVVDALELVDVDIKQCELVAPAGSLQLAFDLFTEQHPVRQGGQRIVMREVRDLLIGAPALRYILDDVDQILGFAGLISNSDTPRRVEALAQPRAFPGVLVEEQTVGGLQAPVIICGDGIGGRLRK